MFERAMLAIALGCCSFPLAASAQEAVTQETPRGVEHVAPVGGVVWESAAFRGVPGVQIHDAVRANWGAAESVDLAADATLMIIREKRLKACRARTVTSLSGYSFGGWEDCLIDSDQDGRFEKVAFNEVGGAKTIDPPVSYAKILVPVIGEGSASFRKTITFLGKSGADIRLSYREFSNDMARPAFTEDLSLPVPESFPSVMVLKDLKLTLLGLDGDGLRYRIDGA